MPTCLQTATVTRAPPLVRVAQAPSPVHVCRHLSSSEGADARMHPGAAQHSRGRLCHITARLRRRTSSWLHPRENREKAKIGTVTYSSSPPPRRRPADRPRSSSVLRVRSCGTGAPACAAVASPVTLGRSPCQDAPRRPTAQPRAAVPHHGTAATTHVGLASPTGRRPGWPHAAGLALRW